MDDTNGIIAILVVNVFFLFSLAKLLILCKDIKSKIIVNRIAVAIANW